MAVCQKPHLLQKILILSLLMSLKTIWTKIRYTIRHSLAIQPRKAFIRLVSHIPTANITSDWNSTESIPCTKEKGNSLDNAPKNNIQRK